MTKRETERFQKILLTKKSDLLNKSQLFKEDRKRENGTTGDEADAASSELELGLDIRFHERERYLILKIESALARIEQGVYGCCNECGDNIAVKRLEARPEATLCAPCKEEQEHKEQLYATV